jgi:AcrR family transcriptional regulator
MPSSPPVKGPSDGLSRPDTTRRRLIEAALGIFAEHGFEGVRTRALADAAGANQAAIPYYFGGKQGLYLAVARYIAEEYGAQLAQIAAKATDALDREDLPRKRIAGRIQALLADTVRAALGSPDAAARTAFIVREQLRPTPAFEVIYREAFEPLHGALSRLVGRLIHRSADDPETVLGAHALIGQVLGFAVARAALLRRLDWQEFTPQRVERIAGIVGSLAAAALSPAAQNPGHDA